MQIGLSAKTIYLLLFSYTKMEVYLSGKPRSGPTISPLLLQKSWIIAIPNGQFT